MPVVIKLWHQRYLSVFTSSHQGSHQEPCPTQRGITLRQPFPEFNCFNVRLSVDKQTSASWHQDAGTRTVQFTTKRRSDKTQILFKPIRTLEVCGRIYYCFHYVNFGISSLFDVKVMMKSYFMRIILYLVFTVFCLKDNEMIFGCIGLTDIVVCSNLSYSLLSALSV